MLPEKFRYLAGVIAAHPNRELIGRTRLQKTVKLLQRKGLPTDYGYMTYFYGPYSEGVQADIGLLETLGLVHEDVRSNSDGSPFYILKASAECKLAELEPLQPLIDKLAKQTTVILELAATYDTFREQGDSHEVAKSRVERKKGAKCEEGRLEKALLLLGELNLPTR